MWLWLKFHFIEKNTHKDAIKNIYTIKELNRYRNTLIFKYSYKKYCKYFKDSVETRKVDLTNMKRFR